MKLKENRSLRTEIDETQKAPESSLKISNTKYGCKSVSSTTPYTSYKLSTPGSFRVFWFQPPVH